MFSWYPQGDTCPPDRVPLHLQARQILASQYAVHAHIVVFAEAQDDLAQGALVLEASFLVSTPAADVLFHILGLDTIEVQFHKAIAHHQSGRLGAIAFAPCRRVADDDIKLGCLIEMVDILEANQANESIVAVEGHAEDDVLAVFVEQFEAFFAACIASGVDGEVAANLCVVHPG